MPSLVGVSMNIRLAIQTIACFGLSMAVHAAAGAEHSFERATMARLASLRGADSLVIDGFPTGPGSSAAVRFRHAQVYSNDAHIYLVAGAGKTEIPRSERIYLRGYSDDKSTRVALALNPDLSVAHGSGTGPEGSFLLRATTTGGASNLVAQKMKPPPGSNFDFRCGNDDLNLDLSTLGSVAATQVRDSLTSQALASSNALRFAVVAVDTDSLFMQRLFNNNTANAADWIAGMFNTMNLMYETDLLVQLQIGTTILRTSPGTDPYTSLTSSATTAGLDLFANYWKTNEGAVTRAFAILLSGAISSTQNSCSSSGLAWIKQYCQKGFAQNSDTVGSYSLNEVCTSIDIDPDGSFAALIVGHELGHNFGAYHTHCTNASTGVPTASNFIDQCFSGESTLYNNQVFACYSGTQSCPAAGAGTIMSYCNFSGSGCDSGTQNLLEFHPAHIAKLDQYIGATSGCLNTTDDVFFSNFE